MRIRSGNKRKRGILSVGVLALLLVTLVGGALGLGLFSTTVVEENVLRGPYVVLGVEHVGSDRQIFQVVESTVRPALADLHLKLAPGMTCGVLYDYPWNVPRSNRRNLAGVLLDPTQGELKTELPLRTELIPRRNVLVVRTTAHPSVASLLLFPKVRRWLAKNHLTPTGPALELYRADGTMEVEVPVAPIAATDAITAVPPAVVPASLAAPTVPPTSAAVPTP